MKKWLKYLCTCTVILVLLAIGLDKLYTSIYSNNSQPRTVIQNILGMENQKLDVVFVGSSRVLNHVDAAYFEELTGNNTMNLCVEGAIFSDNHMLLELLLAKNDVKEVYLQVDHRYLQDLPSPQLIAQCQPFLYTNEIVQSYLFTYDTQYKWNYYFPFYRYLVNAPKIGFRELVLNYMEKKSLQASQSGFLPLKGRYKDTPLTLSGNWTGIDQQTEAIAELCKSKGIQLTYFTAPYSPRVKNRKAFKELNALLPNFKNYAEVIDNPSEYYFDNAHLNAKGARLFTELLAENWKTPDE